jgi:hypothetical protein
MLVLVVVFVELLESIELLGSVELFGFIGLLGSLDHIILSILDRILRISCSVT